MSEDLNQMSEKAASILSLAQRVHDETIESAKKEAETIRVEAKEESEKLLSDAEKTHRTAEEEANAKAQESIEAAKDEAEEIKNEARKEVDSHKEELQKLIEFEASYRQAIVAALSNVADGLGLELKGLLPE